MKRTLKLLLLTISVLIIICGLSIVSNAGNTFLDVGNNNWAVDSIYFCYYNNFITSSSDNYFYPSQNLTRGMAIQAIARATGNNLSNFVNTGFTDVPYGSIYAGSVKWAVDNGITSGTSSTTFSPNSPITREAFCALIYRTFEAFNKTNNLPNINTSTTFSDQNSISSWIREEEIDELVEAGIIVGYSDNTFRPRDNIVRNAGSVVIMKLYALWKTPSASTKIFIRDEYGIPLVNATPYVYYYNYDTRYDGIPVNMTNNLNEEGVLIFNGNYNKPFSINIFASGHMQFYTKTDITSPKYYIETFVVERDPDNNYITPIENFNALEHWENTHEYVTFCQNFGWRYGTTNQREFHQGIDIAEKTGKEVYSSSPGKVILTANLSGYGKIVQVEHKYNYISNGTTTEKKLYYIYQHLNTITVTTDNENTIDMGTQIGTVGNTGLGTGPHLHFSISTSSEKDTNSRDYIDPLSMLRYQTPYS